ncbi:hypothetical protein D3C74_461130 [compost metagenome]
MGVGIHHTRHGDGISSINHPIIASIRLLLNRTNSKYAVIFEKDKALFEDVIIRVHRQHSDVCN